MSPSNKRFLLFGCSCLLLAGLFSCSHGSIHHIEYAYGFGTTWDIHLYQGKPEDASDIVSYIQKTSVLLDVHASAIKNGLYALNSQGSVEADPFLTEAILLGQRVEALSHDAYSIRIGALSSAWKSALDKGEVVDEDVALDLARIAQDTVVTVNGNHIEKVGEGLVDLSSLGKGLCLSQIEKQLRNKGINRYFISAGTSSLLLGSNSSSSGETKINLVDAPGRSFHAKDCAVSCSSVKEQAKVIHGVTYSHIVDPRNGIAHVEPSALVLKGNDAGLLDALSTAYLVLGPEYASELGKLGLSYAYMDQGKVIDESDGFLS